MIVLKCLMTIPCPHRRQDSKNKTVSSSCWGLELCKPGCIAVLSIELQLAQKRILNLIEWISTRIFLHDSANTEWGHACFRVFSILLKKKVKPLSCDCLTVFTPFHTVLLAIGDHMLFNEKYHGSYLGWVSHWWVIASETPANHHRIKCSYKT